MTANTLQKVLNVLEEYGVDTSIIGCKAFEEIFIKINKKG